MKSKKDVRYMIYEETDKGTFFHHSTTSLVLHLAKKRRMIEQGRPFNVVYKLLKPKSEG